MKNLTKVAGMAAVALALTQSIQAVPVTGSIEFSGLATLNTSSAATATNVTAWSGTEVKGVSAGSTFASYITPVATATFNNSMVWMMNGPGTAINNFWQAGGFTFTLDSWFMLSHGGTPGVSGFVVVDGTGYVSGNGYTPTLVNWSFTCLDATGPNDRPEEQFTATATPVAIPDGGSTVLLLGIALSGAALLRRKFMA
jgi:hypothetical protein